MSEPVEQISPSQQARDAGILTTVRILIAAASAAFLVLFLYCAITRMRYPYEVEWIESGMLMSVLRIVHGQALYVRPTLEFVPYLYAPLYFYVSAGMIKLTGVAHGYLALRLVSTLSALGGCGAIYAMVITETRQRIAGIAAAGLYLGSYAISASFYDIGRVDSLFVMLLLLALLAQRRGHPLVAAALWTLTFQTKQTALMLAIVMLAGDWLIDVRTLRRATGLLAFAAFAGLSVLLFQHQTHGWYGFYLFHIARSFGIVWQQAADYLPSLVLAPMAVGWTVVFAAMILCPFSLRGKSALWYWLVSLTMVCSIWFVAAHKGAVQNVVMPMYAWTAVLIGVAAGKLLNWTEIRVKERWRQRAQSMVLAGALVQLIALTYAPGRWLPPPSAALQTEGFLAQLRAIPGDVYVLNHTYDALLAGKQPHAEGEAIGSVIDAHAGQISSQLHDELYDAVRKHRYAAMVMDDSQPSAPPWGFERDYPIEVSTELRGLRHFTSQPQWILLPADTRAEVLRGVLRPDSVVAGVARGNPALATAP